ncbi:MAG: CBS domain-containing protein [Myxococcota bacterium]
MNVIRDIMTTEVVTANLRDGLRQTFYRMLERDIRHMPVLDDEERLVGIVSDRDLRRPDWVDAEENVAHYYLLDNNTKVESAMSAGPDTVGPEDNIAQAVALFRKNRYGALPVIDGERRVLGMVSIYDLLKAFPEG